MSSAFETRTAYSPHSMNRISGRKLVVHAVEKILFVPLVMHHREFRRIEKAAAIQSAGEEEISPVLAAVGEIKGRIAMSRTIHTRL